MPSNPQPAPARLEDGWHAIVVASGALLVTELARGQLGIGATTLGPLGRVGCVFAMLVGLLAVLALHHGLAWTLASTAITRFGMARATYFGSIVLFGVYGWFWQATVTGGDGIAASSWGTLFKVVLGVGAPLGLGLLAGFVFWPGRIRPLVRTLVLLALFVAGSTMTLLVTRQYPAFHGFLGGFDATVAALLAGGRRATRPLSLALGGLGVVGVFVLAPRALETQAYARRFTRLPGTMLGALPATRALLPSVAPFVDPSSRPAPAREPVRAEPKPGAARGDSVLLVVLEATRSDVWADPAIAPEFSRWRSHGLYVPRAVSQYPATPLAYGAMFTSHAPSVVAQSRHWTKHRLFDSLVPKVGGVFLSQPTGRWFDTGAMTSFITAGAVPVRRHADTRQGLAELKGFLEGDAGKGAFFGWIHLFDPHRPYDARGGVSPKASDAERYRSEVRALDADLGQFMRWFYAQPFAERTLVLVLGDHGEAVGEVIGGEPHLGHHVHVTDIIAHVPFYASGPGLPAGSVGADLAVCQLDVMPTIFDHLGIALPARFAAQGMALPRIIAERPIRSLPTEAFSIRGREFFQFMKSSNSVSVSKQRQFFRNMWETGAYPPKLSIERGSWKIVRDALVREDTLFDLRADPRETRNVAGERPVELAMMRRALVEWTETQVALLHELESLK